MDNDHDRLRLLRELRRQLNELAGRQIEVSDEHLLHFIFPIASSTVDDTGEVTFERIFLPGKSCSQMRLLDVAGNSTTANDGRRVFLLSDFLCSTQNSFAAPANLLATPRSTNPCYATSSLRLVPNPALPNAFSDLEITLCTWGPSGAPAAGISVDWRCRLVQFNIVL
jgi:hypothetical protein